MSGPALDIVLLGLSITSSWGNGHATNYRGLMRALEARGHRALFLERDVPWYASQRDLPNPPWGETALYGSQDELKTRFRDRIAGADLVVVGSYVPEGAAVGAWVCDTAGGLTAFYDLDTPVTIAALSAGGVDYISDSLIPRYHLYLSFTGGPILEHLERDWGSPGAHAFHCLVDERDYFPERVPERWLLGYMGTYSADRQPALERLLIEPARALPRERFVVAGSGYPEASDWPGNIERIEHLPPAGHRAFYNSQRFTLNITRTEMVRWGYAPSVRLFEAACCGVPVISDAWNGLETFFEPGVEILTAATSAQALEHLQRSAAAAREIGARARARVLERDTAEQRVIQLEELVYAQLHLRGSVDEAVSAPRSA